MVVWHLPALHAACASVARAGRLRLLERQRRRALCAAALFLHKTWCLRACCRAAARVTRPWVVAGARRLLERLRGPRYLPGFRLVEGRVRFQAPWAQPEGRRVCVASGHAGVERFYASREPAGLQGAAPTSAGGLNGGNHRVKGRAGSLQVPFKRARAKAHEQSVWQVMGDGRRARAEAG